MSLINEALKKAQSQRTNPPGSPPPDGTPPVASAGGSSDQPKPNSFGKVGVLIAVCAVIVSLSVLATVFLLKSPAPAQPVAIVTPPDPLVAAAHNEPARVTQTPPASAPSNAAVTPAIPIAALQSSHGTLPSKNLTVAKPVRPSEVTAPALASNAAAETAGAEVAVAPAPTTPPPEPSPVKVTMRIQALVDKFRVTGIRLSDTDSKVILNEHLFRVDDPVESSIGLRLTKIDEHRLTFIDADGNVYVKRF